MSEKTLPAEAPVCEEYCVHPHSIGPAAEMMPDTKEIETLANVFKIFGDSTRMRIILALFMGELCVCDLSEVLEMTQSAISHQLRLLRGSGLVKTRRQGKSIFYSLDDDHVYSIINQGLAHIRHIHTDKE